VRINKVYAYHRLTNGQMWNITSRGIM
jgi:hypothetical protein